MQNLVCRACNANIAYRCQVPLQDLPVLCERRGALFHGRYARLHTCNSAARGSVQYIQCVMCAFAVLPDSGKTVSAMTQDVH